MLPFEKVAFQYVTPYSDGLDSFAQAQLLEKEVGRNKILKMRSARIGQDSDDLQRPVLRVPRSLGSMPKPEQTYRTRPFVFFSFAGIGAFVANSEAVVIGESGQGALGPALVRYADEWPFRSTHPGFISRLEKYLSLAFHTPIHFRMPQLWRTKGEVLLSLKDDGLLGNWTGTSSCSVRPANRHGGRACGICGGCMLRALATHSAGVTDPSYNPAFDPTQIRAVASDRMAMSTSERHMVVRSMGSMAEFAKLDRDDSKSVIQSESMLFMNPKPTQVQIKLRDLIARHAKEWANYLENLPAGGWAHKFAEQL
jgi:7-cyano-7-deazaguanine synthase in queuosine biosynthesis